MSYINFNLQSPKSIKPTTINLVFRYNGIKIKLSTGVRTQVKFWNKQTQRIKKVKQKSKAVNNLMDKLEASCITYVHTLIAKGRERPDFFELKEELFGVSQKNSSRITLITYMQDFCERKRLLWSRSTYLSYKNTLRWLKIYFDESNNSDHFDDINMVFYEAWTTYMYSPPRNFSINNVGKHIQNLKSVLNSAVRDKVNKNLSYKEMAFKKVSQQTDNIYLSLKELGAIANQEFEFDYLKRARDILLILCYTGVRFSDLPQVCRDNMRWFN